mmetsp:Transcript_12816/g.37396  ORF Transcript_12816/g.37396 Transcript_12816/m.37396 type:complete len:228 (-) Transcript_12816:935-1618(-)
MRAGLGTTPSSAIARSVTLAKHFAVAASTSGKDALAISAAARPAASTFRDAKACNARPAAVIAACAAACLPSFAARPMLRARARGAPALRASATPVKFAPSKSTRSATAAPARADLAFTGPKPRVRVSGSSSSSDDSPGSSASNNNAFDRNSSKLSRPFPVGPCKPPVTAALTTAPDRPAKASAHQTPPGRPYSDASRKVQVRPGSVGNKASAKSAQSRLQGASSSV